jgi:hypothetical protein
MAEDFGVQGRGAFYDVNGTIRDVVQNHLFQVPSSLTMEPSEAIRDRAKVLRAIPAIAPAPCCEDRGPSARALLVFSRPAGSGDGASVRQTMALTRRGRTVARARAAARVIGPSARSF